MLDSLGLGQSPQEVAGLLIARALTRTVVELIEPYRRDFPEEVGEFGEELREFLSEREYVIDERFLDHPRELNIVGEFQQAFAGWLKFVNMRGHVAETIAARVPSRFVYALHRECVERPGDYAKLFAALEGRFTEAWRRERSWEEYRHWLESSLDESVFGEDFGLRQIFLWPRAWYSERVKRGGRRRGGTGHEEERRQVVDLRAHLDMWMRKPVEGHNAVRVISGDPGAGKSSFARMYAAHRMDEGDRVLLVPLHMLNVAHDLREALMSLCVSTPPFPDVPFEAEGRLLLILDGLDELSKQGSAGARLAYEFAQHVQQLVNSRNLGGERLRVILSGRPIAVGELDTVFRATGQLLHLLPYAVPSQADWDDPGELLAVDQRDVWWHRYGELTGYNYDRLPKKLAGKSLFETTSQPLLGYLLALVHRDALARNQAIAGDVSLNEVYGQLLCAVYERDYDKAAGGHKAVRALTREQFEQLLEEIALVAWHADTRVVQVSALEAACTRSGLDGTLRAYIDSAQTGVSQLFTAFYFRRSGGRAGGDETFEFTHKSFVEYLVARRFVAEVAAAAEQLAERRASAGRHARGKHAAAVLLDWLYVFGPSPITWDLLPCLEVEVRLRSDGKEIAGKWQDALCELVEEVQREGSPCERVGPGLSFKQMLRWSTHAELALLAILQCSATVTERQSEVTWESEDACRTWLMRLRAPGSVIPVALGWLVLRGQLLVGMDLRSADLRHADLRGVDLGYANLRYADFWGANLQGANLQDADLYGTDLRGVNLRNANLRDVDLRRANLQDADLCGANLESADLREANLYKTVLRGANLQEADLWRATSTTPPSTTACSKAPGSPASSSPSRSGCDQSRSSSRRLPRPS